MLTEEMSIYITQQSEKSDLFSSRDKERVLTSVLPVFCFFDSLQIE